MRLDEIETNLKKLCENISKENFIYDLLLACGKPKSSIARLKQKGANSYNLSASPSEILWKNNIYFKKTKSHNLNKSLQKIMTTDAADKYRLKFLIVTNFEDFLVYDLETNEKLEIKIDEIHKHPSFLLSLSGNKKIKYSKDFEKSPDIKASEKVAKLFDLLKENNNFQSKKALHEFNVFFARLLFCFFAEDTGIFGSNQFTNGISAHTNDDGNDVDQYLDKVFLALNTKTKSNMPTYLKKYPYVNGGLFADSKYPSPTFSKKARELLLQCGGELDWAEINPDIFGSMIQAIVHPETRGEVGIHYTSVDNILKVINPLFIDELEKQLKNSLNDEEKLIALYQRIQNIKIFDPACGSGNFLIVAYEMLCNIEIKILKRLKPSRPLPKIKLKQFYGIETDDFAHEVAQLSLLLAEHKMHLKYKSLFGMSDSTLPLKKGGNILNKNALLINWEEVCPNEIEEVYVVGNPPYVGFSMQNSEQKESIKKVIGSTSKLDYISCWFIIRVHNTYRGKNQSLRLFQQTPYAKVNMFHYFGHMF